jgi:hypothetical protein
MRVAEPTVTGDHGRNDIALTDAAAPTSVPGITGHFRPDG